MYRLRHWIGAPLALLLVFETMPAKPAARPKAADEQRQFQVKLTKEQQLEHALDRLTFGPRPGDLDQIRKLGLNKWIDLELHPELIAENPLLESKLQPLESLNMSPLEIVEHYPTRQMIAAIARGKEQMPDDPLLRATLERLVKRYRARRLDDKNTTSADDLDPVTPLEQLVSADQLKTLKSGKPEERRQVIESIPREQWESAVIAMDGRMRNQLLPAAPESFRRMLMLANAPQQVVNYDLNAAKMYRAVYSNHQLQEEMVDFWYNHFNVYLDKGSDRFLVPSYERDAIRPHVFGHFRELLEATAKSPAMLFYLDNWQSVGPPKVDPKQAAKGGPKKNARGLNENYGRELLELHTLGVDGGYTQKDVTEVARCFTGWTIREPRRGGGFEYNDKVHDKGEKIVLGVTIPADGGMEDGEKVLDILLHHPSTAHFISLKLAQRFVADNPPPALVDRMARTFTATEGDIRAVMKTMLDSKEFWSAGAYHAKVKTPFEMIASAVRALNADVDYVFPLSQQVAQLGQPPYRKQEPTGYSAANAEWMNSAALLARMNFSLALAQNKIQGVKVDTKRFADAGEDPRKVARVMMLPDLKPETRTAIEAALKEQAAKDPKAKPAPELVAGLVLGSPDFQRR